MSLSCNNLWLAAKMMQRKKLCLARHLLRTAIEVDNSKLARPLLVLVLNDEDAEQCVQLVQPVASECPLAKNLLAFFKNHGMGTEKDETGALELYKQAAASGCSLAQTNLAVQLYNLAKSSGLEQQQTKEVVSLLKKAGKGGVGSAYRMLSALDSFEKREYWLEQAAQERQPVALTDYFRIIRCGQHPEVYSLAFGGIWMAIKDLHKHHRANGNERRAAYFYHRLARQACPCFRDDLSGKAAMQMKNRALSLLPKLRVILHNRQLPLPVNLQVAECALLRFFEKEQVTPLADYALALDTLGKSKKFFLSRVKLEDL